MSKTGRGGDAARRDVSRPTRTAAMTKTTTPAMTAKAIATSVAPCSDPDALGEELAPVRGIAEQQLARLGALEVQVRRVLPGEADATVDLDVVGAGVEVRLRAVRLGERRDGRKLVVELGRAPAGVVRGGLGRLNLEQHVSALVLDGLERPDGASELDAVLGVLHRHLQHELRATDLLGGESDGGEVEHAVDHRPALAFGADERGRCVAQLEACL